jgi:hypothetical protein
MTPMYNKLRHHFPAWLSTLILSAIYAALLILNFTLLISPHTFGVIYLDIGR